MSLLRKNKKGMNLNERCVTNNTSFWKTVKPFLSDKVMTKDKINLIENDELVKSSSMNFLLV